jgi:two-component system LytT family response regulator
MFTDSEQALEIIKRDTPDILFLDVEMPFMSGFDVVQALGPTPISVIFTTAFDMYAVQAFKVNAVDYLLKPIDKDELINAVNKVIQKPQVFNQELLTGLIRSAIDQQPPKKVVIHTQEGIHLILLQDILYCKSEGSY